MFTSIGTHAVQNISLTSGEPGELTVTGDFITNTSALGMLAIVYSTINDSDIHYTEARLPQTEISLTGLSGNSYSVSAFDIEENGLPFNITATSPKEIAINRGMQQMCTCIGPSIALIVAVGGGGGGGS